MISPLHSIEGGKKRKFTGEKKPNEAGEETCSDKNKIIDFFTSVGYGKIEVRERQAWGRNIFAQFFPLHKCCQHNKMCFA